MSVFGNTVKELMLIFITAVIYLFLSGYMSEASRVCFNCTSVQQPSCRDPFATEGRVSYICPSGSACVKVITGSQVTRGCMAIDQRRPNALHTPSGTEDENCYTDRISPSFEERTVCMCDGDLCNLSTPIYIDVRVAIAVLIAPLLVWA